MTTQPGPAVVIGASIAGLLAAAALVEQHREVVVLDRDRLPEAPLARAGAPHSRHLHGLLASGRTAMEELLPGLTDELVADGAHLGDFQQTTSWYVEDHPLARGTSGLLALAVSRPLLEWRVRQRVAALPGVQIRDRTSVLDLVFAPGQPPAAGRVVGVATAPLDAPGTRHVLDTALVVDASGRTSRTGEWLQRRGHAVPPEEHVRIDVCYATRTFRRRPDDLAGRLAVLQPPDPRHPRGAVLIAQESDRWIVGLTGYHGDRPPVALPEFTAYAQTVTGPIGRLLPTLEPLDDGATYRFAANVRRHYERLRHLPEGLLAIGDAICAFDPAYGQGMSVAALEAIELRECLALGRANLARRYFRRAAAHVDNPWTLVVGRNRELPGSTGAVPLATRLTNRYLRAVLTAGTRDPAVATAFLRVSHLTAPPHTLMAPRVLARVAAAARTQQPAARTQPPATPAQQPTTTSAAHVIPDAGSADPG